MSPQRKLAVADGPDLDDELKSYDDRFSKNIGYSAIGHVALILMFTVKVFFFPDSSDLQQSAVRVDLVALPDKIQEPQAPPKQEAEPPPPAKKHPVVQKEKPVEEKTVVLKPKKDNTKKQEEALKRLKQMQALEDIEKDVKKEKAVAVTYKGNQVSKGSDLRGLSLLQHESYVSDVERHIRRYWVIPQWLANKNLRTKVRVKFDDSGAVTSRDIVQSSGNPSFDQAVLETLEKASPVPKPPEKLQRVLAYEGILVGFPE